MKKIFFTPGPAQLYPTVEAHLQEALDNQVFSISHRSKEYEVIHARSVDAVRQLINVPDDFHVFFHSSANEIWERLLQNCVTTAPFHFVNGSFSERFYNFAEQMGLSPLKAEVEWGKGGDFSTNQVPAEVEMINFTHNETSTGVMTPLESIYSFRDSHPDAILTLDIVSSVPFPQVDWKKIDAGYFSVQKGMGLPAGLGVLILGPGCVGRSAYLREHGHVTGTYHSFESQMEKAVKNQTPETPNVLGIYLLGEVIGDMLYKGIKKIRKETLTKANMLYDYFESRSDTTPFVKEKTFQSPTVLVIEAEDSVIKEIMQKVAQKGFVLGSGYGSLKNSQIRIANFPAVSIADVEALMEAMG